MLGITHTSSAGSNPCSNGMCEMAVKRLSEGIRRYASDTIDDRQIELILPIIEMSMRAISSSAMGISPFEVVNGYPMPLPSPVAQEQPMFLNKDAQTYAAWLKNALKLLHEAVYENRVEAKQEMKRRYDKRHAVRTPTLKVGDHVLLLQKKIKPHSDRVLTHTPYVGPYIIAEIVQRDSLIGQAYKLVSTATGKSLSGLVNPDRIKLYN